MQIVTLEQAPEILGEFQTRVSGFTVFVYDPAEFMHVRTTRFSPHTLLKLRLALLSLVGRDHLGHVESLFSTSSGIRAN